MARPELPGAAAPIQPPVSPFRWAARTRFSSLLPKCSFIFRMVVVYWSWNCESCPEIKYFSLFLRTALLFQLIPARGRKRLALLPMKLRSVISTYPRKGTETSMLVLIITVVHAFQLIPVRGRKRYERRHVPDRSAFQLIPARGRKPNQIVLSRQALAISTYPRKNPLRRCAPALPKGELL